MNETFDLTWLREIATFRGDFHLLDEDDREQAAVLLARYEAQAAELRQARLDLERLRAERNRQGVELTSAQMGAYRLEKLLRQAVDRYSPAEMPEDRDRLPERYEDEEWEFWRQVAVAVTDAARARGGQAETKAPEGEIGHHPV